MTSNTNTPSRRLRFEIFRFNPEDPATKPHMQTFELDETPYMSLFLALNEIRETQDPSLQFDFSCRSAICGSCGMMVNGRPVLGCRTLTEDLPEVIRLHPLPVFKLVGDLSVDTGTWFREMAEKTEAWIHAREAFDPAAQEDRMDDDVAEAIYERDRCIECGCCIASCGVANLNAEFVAPAGPEDWFEVVANEEGVFGCLGMMACHDICPKELPLLDVYAYLRRKALAASFPG
jgi:fumarate reductase iron-sulfur subunit